MPYINDTAFDQALNWIKSGVDRISVCTEDPADAAASRTNPPTGNSLGFEAITSANVTGPGAGTPTGRSVTMDAITDGDIDATGTAARWALSNSSQLLAYGNLSAPQAVTTGNKFTLGAFDITILDAT